MARADLVRPLTQRNCCPLCLGVFRGAMRLCPTDGVELEPLPRDPQLGAQLGGRYEIRAVIGETALGRIYRAWDQRDQRDRAVRIMYGDYAALPERSALFELHVARAGMLDHAGIVLPVEAGVTDQGIPYLVTTIVYGPRLAEVIRSDAPLAVERTRRITGELLGALQHIHEAGIVHGDLTGWHVILTATDDGSERTMLELGRPGNLLGTFPYRAPEQGMSNRPDPRSDLYAVGVLLYEMLCGESPFAGSFVSQALQSASGRPPPIAERVPGLTVDPGMEAIAQVLLSTAPDERFVSARQAREALADVAL